MKSRAIIFLHQVWCWLLLGIGWRCSCSQYVWLRADREFIFRTMALISSWSWIHTSCSRWTLHSTRVCSRHPRPISTIRTNSSDASLAHATNEAFCRAGVTEHMQKVNRFLGFPRQNTAATPFKFILSLYCIVCQCFLSEPRTAPPDMCDNGMRWEVASGRCCPSFRHPPVY